MGRLQDLDVTITGIDVPEFAEKKSMLTGAENPINNQVIMPVSPRDPMTVG